MVAVINLGVDLGSTGLRAAYGPAGEPARFLTLSGRHWPWPLCEPGTDARPLMSFPSLKSKLGLAPEADVAGRTVSPAEIVTQALRQVRQQVVAATSAAIGETVISVPARYFSSQRGALLDAAHAAGFGSVSLVTDSVAAVIGHCDGTGTGTFLVYGMGYSGFELGLVRAVRGRYRVLGYDGANAPGGSTLDEHVLHAWLAVLRQNGSLPDEVQQGDSGWLRLREMAEWVKERLAAAESRVLFPMFVAGHGGGTRLTGEFDQRSFDLLVQFLAGRTLDRVDALYEQAGISKTNVDAVLLVGGSTRIPQLRRLVSTLGHAVPTGSDHIARGAALHAHLLSGKPSAGFDDELVAADFGQNTPVAEAPPLAAALLTAPGSAPLAAAGEVTGLDRARQLVSEGRHSEAEAGLKQLIAGAQDLLGEITAIRSRGTISSEEASAGDGQLPPGARSAADLIAVARRRFDMGESREAIHFAHLAWQREPDSPSIFEAMIDIHCDAAMASPTAAGYADEQHWLRCALYHDPSNTRVRGLLAERIYLHGKELHRSGQKDEARRAIEHALSWNPDHQAAGDLLHRLRGRR